MSTFFRKSALIATTGLALSGASQAALFDAPVASNAYINHAGLNWAWASPAAADGSHFGRAVDLSFQAAYGWRLPTAAEMLAAPSAKQFIFDGANVPLRGADPVSGSRFQFVSAALNGDAACAAAYFNNNYFHCDWGDAPGSSGDHAIPWWGQAGARSVSESLVVRAVPEPSPVVLLALGLAGLGVASRRRAL